MQDAPVGKFLGAFAGAASPQQMRESRATRDRGKEGILADKSALIWGAIEGLPRVDAPRLSVKRPKPAAYVKPRYRKLRRAAKS